MPEGQDLVAIGADLAPGTVLSAYQHGCFPMPVDGTFGWFSPEHRGIIRPSKLRISKSLRKSARRFRTTVNTAFDQVILGCADPSRTGSWIDDNILTAYSELHRMGWVHSIEVWDEDSLAGGLYGIGMGSFFAGESMFHRRTDASKVALMRLTELVQPDPASARPTLIDVQWQTDHLQSLGAEEISRHSYQSELAQALVTPGPFPRLVLGPDRSYIEPDP